MRLESILIAGFVVLLCACPAFAADNELRLSSTTSTDNTGLLEYMLKPFEKEFSVKVHVIAVGTGKALKLAENGDVDVTLVHAPSREEKFVKSGFGVNRRLVMANYFLIVGPSDDPAGVKQAS